MIGRATLAVAGAALVIGASMPGIRHASAAPATPPATPPAVAPRLTIARLQYEGGGDWYANPSSIPNLLKAIRQRTSFPAEQAEARITLGEIGRAHV